MLGRLLSGAGMMKFGSGLMRRGHEMKARARAAPLAAASARRSEIINRVKTKTRGLMGVSNPRLFSKGTLAGQKRRNQAAALIRGQRAGLPQGMTHAKLRAAHVQKIISGVKARTRMGLPAQQLSKKTPGGFNTRAMLARTIKAARQSGGSVVVNGKNVNLRQKRKFQGSP